MKTYCLGGKNTDNIYSKKKKKKWLWWIQWLEINKYVLFLWLINQDLMRKQRFNEKSSLQNINQKIFKY